MAAVRACHAALPYLERQGGSIIHISSISGLGASVRNPPYGAVKATLMEYTQTQAGSVRRQAHPRQLHRPGSIFFKGGFWDRNQRENPALYASTLSHIPSGRFGKPEEVSARSPPFWSAIRPRG